MSYKLSKKKRPVVMTGEEVKELADQVQRYREILLEIRKVLRSKPR